MHSVVLLSVSCLVSDCMVWSLTGGKKKSLKYLGWLGALGHNIRPPVSDQHSEIIHKNKCCVAELHLSQNVYPTSRMYSEPIKNILVANEYSCRRPTPTTVGETVG